MVCEDLPNILKNLLGLSFGIDVHILLQLIIILDDLPRLRLVCDKPLLDALQIIVRPSAGLAPFQQSGEHHLLAALEVEDEGDVDGIVHQFLPGRQVLNVPGKAVNQKPAALHARPLHRLLQQHHRDLAGHYLPLHDEALYRLAELRPRLLTLRPQKVARGEVHEVELCLDTLALSALARAGPAEDEDHSCLLALHGCCQLYKDTKDK